MNTRPPQLAFDLDRDVHVLSAMAAHVTPYLYENELYGYLSGDLPKLTLGGLLLRLYRLNRVSHLLDSDQQARVQEAQRSFDTERARWAAHYEIKLGHELGARITALDSFLQECHEDFQACAAGYPTQAEKRTMIEHLAAEAEQHNCLDEGLRTHLRRVDNKLRRFLEDGTFIFTDERLKEAYSPEQFWWLYGHIAESKP